MGPQLRGIKSQVVIGILGRYSVFTLCIENSYFVDFMTSMDSVEQS